MENNCIYEWCVHAYAVWPPRAEAHELGRFLLGLRFRCANLLFDLLFGCRHGTHHNSTSAKLTEASLHPTRIYSCVFSAMEVQDMVGLFVR